MGIWTDKEEKRLRELWTAGRTSGEIVKEMSEFTRSAVIAKAHRLGLSPRQSPIKRYAKAKKKAAALYVAQPAPKYNPERFVSRETRAFGDNPRKLKDLNANECRWPIGDPREPDFVFCSAPCRGVYCYAHKALAYNPPKDSEINKLLR